jgi:hypothetical protein
MGNITNLAGSVGAASPTTEVHSSQLEKLGQLAVDSDNNIFMYVDFLESCIAGEWVVINSAFGASQISASLAGRVGVVVGTVSASDRYGWVQIYGVHTAAWGTSGITSGEALVVAATTDLGHVAGMTTTVGVVVFGAIARSNPDTCASTALSTSALAAPFTVELNFPYVSRQQGDLTS